MRGLQDLQILVRTAERGSVSAAARELGVSPAVASLAIKRLEDELGCVLCLRSTRSLRLTQHGERFVAHARQMLASYQQALAELHPQAAPLREVLHLSMPSDFGRNLALGWLDDFQRAHPHVQLRLSLSDRLADMYREPVDLAIRFGLPPDSNLVALPLAECRRVLCAAPSYLARHGAPGCPQALAEHNCLCFIVGERLHNRWRFWRDGGEWVQQVAGDRSADDADVVRRWAVAGHGLVYKSPCPRPGRRPAAAGMPGMARRTRAALPAVRRPPSALAHRAAAARIFARTLPGAAGGAAVSVRDARRGRQGDFSEYLFRRKTT